MARSKAARFPTRKLSDDELLQLFDQSLTTLQHFARIYDEGYPPISLSMATELEKLLIENGAAVRLRKTREFPMIVVDHENQENVLTSLHKLTFAQIGGDPPELSFLPVFCSGAPDTIKQVPFVEWWNRDVIHRASAALPGTPPGMIPVNGSPEVPFKDRETVNRRDFVHLLRLKLGAHQGDEMPLLLDELNDGRNWGTFTVQMPQRVLSTEDGSLPTRVSIYAAMMRQICHEVLTAYGRNDPPRLGPAAASAQENSPS